MNAPMNVAVIGGGPAGLYLALLLKLQDAKNSITLYERNDCGETEGWGVVSWGELLEKLHRADSDSADHIRRESHRWESQVVNLAGTKVEFRGGAGYAIDRRRLVNILADRAEAVGVQFEFGRQITGASDLGSVDLIAACDGAGSRIRAEGSKFGTQVVSGGNWYAWLGTDMVFDAFTFPFVRSGDSLIWAHAYSIASGLSTFVVECTQSTYESLGLGSMSPGDCLEMVGDLFAETLQGRPLMAQPNDHNDFEWLNFRTVTNRRWYHGHTVLVGDAAHTTHFTIGSGTTLALEDSMALAENIRRHDALQDALRAHEHERQKAILQSQQDARYSALWFESIDRYAALPAHQFGSFCADVVRRCSHWYLQSSTTTSTVRHGRSRRRGRRGY